MQVVSCQAICCVAIPRRDPRNWAAVELVRSPLGGLFVRLPHAIRYVEAAHRLDGGRAVELFLDRGGSYAVPTWAWERINAPTRQPAVVEFGGQLEVVA